MPRVTTIPAPTLPTQIYLFDNASIWASGTISASSPTLTLTVPGVTQQQLSTWLNSASNALTVEAATGSLGRQTFYAGVPLTAQSFPAPVLTIAQTGSDTGTQSTSDTIIVTVSSAGNTVTSVEIFDGAKSLGSATSQGDGLWKLNATGLTEGAHTFTAVATDNLGNKTTTSSGVTDLVDFTAPVISGLTQTGSSAGTMSQSETLNLTVADSGSGVQSVEIYDTDKDGTITHSAATQIGTSNNWTYNKNGLSQGKHTFAAVATDKAGNISTAAFASTIIDLVQPVGITSISQTAPAGWNASTSDTVLVTTSGPVDHVDIYDGKTKVGSVAAPVTPGSSIWSFAKNDFSDGTHNLSAVAVTAGPNSVESAPSQIVTDLVDNTGPTISSITQSASGGVQVGANSIWASSKSDTITVTASDATSGVKSVEIYDGATDIGAAVQQQDDVGSILQATSPTSRTASPPK